MDRTKAFSLRVMKLCESLPNNPESWGIRKQLSRCATSVAANYRAAQRGRSKNEFRAKLGIVEEEADESAFWLETVIDSGMLPEARVQPLLDECRELLTIIVSSIKTSRRTSNKDQGYTTHPPSQIPNSPSLIRVGHGFDLHRLEPGLPLIVGGVKLEHDRGCAAHSDGDVVYHAVTDAILGALGLEDIGQLFPDKDPKWKDADSRIFVEEAVGRMREAGYTIGNMDITIILEHPKLSPHKATIKANLAKLLGCDESQVNLKGKTHERVDALGENRAIACHVVVLLESGKAEN